MKAFKTLLAAAILAAGVGAAPLLAQDPQNQQPSMSGEGLTRIQVEGKITDVDKGTNQIVVETKEIPGHTGATMKLVYSVTDIAIFDKFNDGDNVIADVIVTDKGPTVEAIHVPGETPVAGDSVAPVPAPAPTPDAVTPTPAPTTDAPATPDSDRDAMKGDKSGDVPATDSTANPKTDTDVRPDSTQPPAQVVPTPGSEPSTSAPTPKY